MRLEIPQQLNKVKLNNFFNVKVLTKFGPEGLTKIEARDTINDMMFFSARLQTKLEAKVLTKIWAEVNKSTVKERLPLDDPPNKLPDLHKQLDRAELDGNIFNDCEERIGKASRVRNATRDIGAQPFLQGHQLQ